MFDIGEERRINKAILEYIDYYSLNLEHLVVYTEVGSGYYQFTPMICVIAGAQKVYAVTRDSNWGKADEIKKATYDIINRWDLRDCVEVVEEKKAKDVSKCDIITNLGFVRPIDSEMISWMKATAVIPLMWEAWEFRPNEIDMSACKKRGILVLGTDEHKNSFIKYAGYVVWKLLFESNIEIFKNRFLVMSSDPVARVINELFYNNGIDFMWTSFHENIQGKYRPFHIDRHDRSTLLDFISRCDAVICDEKVFDRPLIHSRGLITPEDLKEANDSIVVIVRSGVIDHEGLRRCGIRVYPETQVPFGYSTTCSYALGPRPVIELHVAGLKVGEAMARARLAGLGVVEAARQARQQSLAQDFEGDLAWIKDL
ncbi:MAG: hypothetical protein JRI36_00345 [Deltaproteobacteria bacterium]|nr:hypothetical protein [Deltaproteobacteria bacterium]